MVSKGPAKQKAAGWGIVGKKAASFTLPGEENENPILLNEVQVVQLKPK